MDFNKLDGRRRHGIPEDLQLLPLQTLTGLSFPQGRLWESEPSQPSPPRSPPWKRLLPPQPGPQDRRSWEMAIGLYYPRPGLDVSAIWDFCKPSSSAISSNPLPGTHWKFIYHPHSCPGSRRVWDPAAAGLPRPEPMVKEPHSAVGREAGQGRGGGVGCRLRTPGKGGDLSLTLFCPPPPPWSPTPPWLLSCGLRRLYRFCPSCHCPQNARR